MPSCAASHEHADRSSHYILSAKSPLCVCLGDLKPMILSAVAACSVQEDNLLLAFAGLLVEDLALSPEWRCDIGVAADDTILIWLSLFIGRS